MNNPERRVAFTRLAAQHVPLRHLCRLRVCVASDGERNLKLVLLLFQNFTPFYLCNPKGTKRNTRRIPFGTQRLWVNETDSARFSTAALFQRSSQKVSAQWNVLMEFDCPGRDNNASGGEITRARQKQ